MGNQSASEMARFTDLDTALEWHMLVNHYPPYPRRMIPFAKAAITAMWQQKGDQKIALPDGVSYKNSTDPIRASDLIEIFHLEPFIDQGDR